MVRPLFYRTDSHRFGLEDVKCRVKGHGTRAGKRTNGKSEVPKAYARERSLSAVASPFFTLLQFSHVP